MSLITNGLLIKFYTWVSRGERRATDMVAWPNAQVSGGGDGGGGATLNSRGQLAQLPLRLLLMRTYRAEAGRVSKCDI